MMQPGRLQQTDKPANLHRRRTSLAAGLLVASLAAGNASAGTETTVEYFSASIGMPPEQNVLPAIDPHGHLFGTTPNGSTMGSGKGTVFQISPGKPAKPAFTSSVLYRFRSTAIDGNRPYNGVTRGADGLLYGMTYFGGRQAACGIVYALTAPASGHGAWTETILHTFQQADTSDGCNPSEQQILLYDGSLYGTTTGGGGGSNQGTLFRLDPPTGGATTWTETILSRFAGGSDGANPQGAIAVDANGNLFGTTLNGGAAALGSVWEYSPATAVRTVIYSFKGGADGASPADGVLGYSDGRTPDIHLLGTTTAGGGSCSGGCGTVFELSDTGQSYVEGVIHAFAGGTDGAAPVGGLSYGPSGIWGATQYGGGGTACNANGCGTLFKLSYPHVTSGFVYAQQYAFPGHTVEGGDQYPVSGVVPDVNNNLFGFTQTAVFEYVP